MRREDDGDPSEVQPDIPYVCQQESSRHFIYLDSFIDVDGSITINEFELGQGAPPNYWPPPQHRVFLSYRFVDHAGAVLYQELAMDPRLNYDAPPVPARRFEWIMRLVPGLAKVEIYEVPMARVRASVDLRPKVDRHCAAFPCLEICQRTHDAGL